MLKKISNCFWNGGIKVNFPITKINIKKIKTYFREFGFILFRGNGFDPNNIKNFANNFTRVFANDANRREKTSYDKYINGVDEGFEKMSLHSEASFSPSWPEILWFFCKKPPTKYGETTFCDGIQLWNILSQKAKNFFLEYPIKFSLKIPVVKVSKKKGTKAWPLNTIGSANSFINYKDGCLYLDQIRFAVNESRISGKLAFSNHFLYKNTDKTIIKWGFVGFKKAPKDIINEVEKKSSQTTYYHKWKYNDLIMIDNKRFMHGRNKLSKNEIGRKVLNMQTLISNISSEKLNLK